MGTGLQSQMGASVPNGSFMTLRRLDLRKTQAARLNTIRGINRQIVLNYIREREPISRAEIARETDLQRLNDFGDRRSAGDGRIS